MMGVCHNLVCHRRGGHLGVHRPWPYSSPEASGPVCVSERMCQKPEDITNRSRRFVIIKWIASVGRAVGIIKIRPDVSAFLFRRNIISCEAGLTPLHRPV